jgi:hypothetical protein
VETVAVDAEKGSRSALADGSATLLADLGHEIPTALLQSSLTREAQSADEALVVDETAPDVADDDAVLVAADTAGDVLLVHDVVTDLRPVNDLAVEAGAAIEDPAEVRAEILMAACEDRASRVFDHTVGREAGDEPIQVSLVVCADVVSDRINHALPLGLQLSWSEYAPCTPARSRGRS